MRPISRRWFVPSTLRIAAVGLLTASCAPAVTAQSPAVTAQSPAVDAPPPPATPVVNIPETVSPEAQAYLRSLPGPNVRPPAPAPDDLEAWKQSQAAREAERLPGAEAAVERYGVTVEERQIGGVPVLVVTPFDWRDNGRVLVYTHGGAYVHFSARCTLSGSAPAAAATGMRIVSIDYTLAPVGKWDTVTDEVVAVLLGLQQSGIAPDKIAIYGDSAGGGLAAGAVLKMRDQGHAMPGAVVLWSPWADITDSGDTAVTLKEEEPTYVYEKHLQPAAEAYADPKHHRHPYVSPVYADYRPGFPPTLIQGGTKETFLSHFVRLYQAIDTAGGQVKLDLYDGMPHVFQRPLAEAPEGKTALAKMRAFLDEHLAD